MKIFSYIRLFIYICCLCNAIKLSIINIIVFVIPTFIHTYIEQNNYSRNTHFHTIKSYYYYYGCILLIFLLWIS